MDYSTEGVTLLNVFLLDILKEVDQLDEDLAGFKELYKDINLDNPYDVSPIETYNKMCDWVEKNLPEDIFMQIGKNIGMSAYKGLIENSIIEATSSPEIVLDGLVLAAASMIQDEKDRGWELLESGSSHVLMRRTQTFSSKLQLGVLSGIIEKCEGISEINVEYQKEIAKGDEFDEYLVTWRIS